MRLGGNYGALFGILALAACTPAPAPQQDYFQPGYLGIGTRLLEDDLVNFEVRMTGARSNADVADYGRCAAAQYAQIRGFGFARHVRTQVTEEAGIWTGDAVYTISPTLPRGLRTIDAQVALDDCKNRGIPAV